MIFKKWKIQSLTRKIKAAQSKRASPGSKPMSLTREIDLLLQLANIYSACCTKKNYPMYSIKYRECLRTAALIDSLQAQYTLGSILLEDAKLRETLEKEGVFSNAMNLKWSHLLYEEAHHYLKAAAKRESVHAKRLLGLAYINGWGVSADKEKGFDLVLASIEQEGSWDKVPQIFEKIGLNKPEFFAALSARRKV